MTSHIEQIRALLDAIERAEPQAPADLAPGDIVQVHPDADTTFGGLLMRVTRVGVRKIEGYLLLPRRGGCRDTWTSFSAPELTRIGKLIHTEPRFGFRAFGSRDECGVADQCLYATGERERASADDRGADRVRT